MKLLLALGAVLLAFPRMVLAVDCPLPDTGQTKCYHIYHEITCPNPGEDFYGQDAQYGPNLQSYTKLDANGNDLPDEATEWVMVRDNVTGLIWEGKQNKDGVRNYATPHDADNVYYWSDSIGDGTGTEDFIIGLNQEMFGGHSDWRLPTIKELSTLIDSSTLYPVPTIDTVYFPNTVLVPYWSSTTLASDTGRAWYVYFRFGSVDDYYKFRYYNVRAVRGGQCGSSGHFIDNDDGTITDTDTGLMWQQTTAPGTYTWQQALFYCDNLSLADYNDWRLPNRNELQSIVDYSRYNQSIDPLFGGAGFNCWSSTSEAYHPDRAWYVYFGEGEVDNSNKSGDWSYRSVRAVRGGQCGSLGDSDGDTVCDDVDNCPGGYNPLQFDCDDDGAGDMCDADTIDTDEDGLDVLCDNCPNHYNPDQQDADADGAGDVCDNCPNHYNPDQQDTDADKAGDVCDNCLNHYNPDQQDTDADKAGDVCDNCPTTPNSPVLGTCYAWSGMITACTGDADCGGIPDSCSANQEDTDGDGRGDVCDNCPTTLNSDQVDSYPPQKNGIGDICDCEGNFNCYADSDVDSTDAAMFKEDIGRSNMKNPCTSEVPCNGDFTCDNDVDSSDAALFKSDFGRSSMSNPCPICNAGVAWCSYQ